MSYDRYNPPQSPKCPECGDGEMSVESCPYPWRMKWTFVCGCNGHRTFVSVPVEGEEIQHSFEDLKARLK